MSLFKKPIVEKTIPQFNKQLVIQEFIQKGQKMYPQWKFLHFKEKNIDDIMVIIPLTRIVKIKIPSMMTYEKETSQTFQHVIIFNVIDYDQHLSYNQITSWENYSHQHYGISDVVSGLQKLRDYQEKID